MRLKTPFVALALLAVVFAGASTAGAAAAEKKVKTKEQIGFKEVASIASPTGLTYAPGYNDLIYVISRFGKIRVIKDGQLLPKPLLDISDMVQTGWIEQGLLGLAFPPDFEKTGRYYIHFTQKNDDIKIDEYQVDPKDPTTTLPFTRRNVLRIPAVDTRGNHNGGEMRFRGGLLYIAVGDGNDPGDKQNLAQSLNSLRGKILRIDPKEDETSGRTYQIPPTNPFVNKPGRDEVFAYGFRNPHSISFDQPKGGELQMLISDVGQERQEEINYLPFKLAWGGNFGWNVFEGILPYDCGADECPNGFTRPAPPNLIFPVLTYSHKEGCAVIGGPVVRDPALGSLSGRMIYGDFCYNRIRTAAPRAGWIADDKPLGAFLPPGKGEHSALNGWGTDADRHVYAYSNFGPIYRVTQTTVEDKPTKAEIEEWCTKKENANKPVCVALNPPKVKRPTRAQIRKFCSRQKNGTRKICVRLVSADPRTPTRGQIKTFCKKKSSLKVVCIMIASNIQKPKSRGL